MMVLIIDNTGLHYINRQYNHNADKHVLQYILVHNENGLFQSLDSCNVHISVNIIISCNYMTLFN